MATTRIYNIELTNTDPQSGQYLPIDSSSALAKINYSTLKTKILEDHESQVSVDLSTVVSGASGGARLMYDPATKLVTIYGDIYNSSNIATNAALYDTIPEAYRPAERVRASGFVYYGSTARAAGIYVNTDGTITQTVSSSMRSIMFIAAYFVE